MELTGRITKNAEVKTVGDDRKVVNFSIAVNDRYKPKGKEVQESTNYFSCSYWVTEAIAKHLLKGSLVQVTGRLSVNPWITTDGEPKVTLNFHVNEIKLLSKPTNAVAMEAVAETANATEDLPF